MYILQIEQRRRRQKRTTYEEMFIWKRAREREKCVMATITMKIESDDKLDKIACSMLLLSLYTFKVTIHVLSFDWNQNESKIEFDFVFIVFQSNDRYYQAIDQCDRGYCLFLISLYLLSMIFNQFVSSFRLSLIQVSSYLIFSFICLSWDQLIVSCVVRRISMWLEISSNCQLIIDLSE